MTSSLFAVGFSKAAWRACGKGLGQDAGNLRSLACSLIGSEDPRKDAGQDVTYPVHGEAS